MRTSPQGVQVTLCMPFFSVPFWPARLFLAATSTFPQHLNFLTSSRNFSSNAPTSIALLTATSGVQFLNLSPDLSSPSFKYPTGRTSKATNKTKQVLARYLNLRRSFFLQRTKRRCCDETSSRHHVNLVLNRLTFRRTLSHSLQHSTRRNEAGVATKQAQSCKAAVCKFKFRSLSACIANFMSCTCRLAPRIPQLAPVLRFCVLD
jgi:hypothetical protein